jgi:hypothetical protein
MANSEYQDETCLTVVVLWFMVRCVEKLIPMPDASQTQILDSESGKSWQGSKKWNLASGGTGPAFSPLRLKSSQRPTMNLKADSYEREMVHRSVQ